MILEALAIYGGYKLLKGKREKDTATVNYICGNCGETYSIRFPQKDTEYKCYHCGDVRNVEV